MNVRIDRTWMTHSGGTKFYQIFEMRPVGGVPITLVHFGKLTNGTGSFPRPVNGGQTKLARGAVGVSKRMAKEARGYVERDTVRTDESMDPGSDFWWRETFGAELAHELRVAMCGHLAGADDAPKVEPDNEFVPAEIEPETRPEAWGTW